jgi:hypothetical protein
MGEWSKNILCATPLVPKQGEEEEEEEEEDDVGGGGDV